MRLIKSFGGLFMLTTERKHKALVVTCSEGDDTSLTYFDFLRESPRKSHIKFTLSVSSNKEREDLARVFSEYEPIERIGDPSKVSPIYIGRRNSYFSSPYITETFSHDIYFLTDREKYQEVKEKILSLPGYKIFDLPLYGVFGIYLLR